MSREPDGAAGPRLRDRRRGRLDPHRRGPHAAHHQRPRGRRGASCTTSSRSIVRGLVRDDDYEVDEEKRTVAPTEAGIEKVEQALGVDNLYDERRRRTYVHQLAGCAAGQGALQARQGLHHPARRGEDRRRVHRPHPRGSALVRRPAPGGRGQGGREDQGGEPDPRHHHAPELLPHVRQARRHDRHGARPRRSEFANTYNLQVVPIPTNVPMIRDDDGRPHLQDRGGEVRRRRRRHRRALRHRPAGARRHGLGREVRDAQSRLLEKRGVEHEVLNAKQHDAGSADRRPGRSPGRGHRRHQHGRSRRRHPPRRQPRGPRAPRRGGRGARPRQPKRAQPLRGAAAEVRGGVPRPRATRSASSAVSTCSAPSATRAAASTTSCVAVRAARAIPARAASTSRSRTSSCACSPPAP